MDDTTILGATLGQLGQTVKQGAKQVVKIPQELAQDVGGQIGVKKQAASAQGFGEPQWKSDEERVKFLRDLYGSDKNINQNPPAGGKPTEFGQQIANKSKEEQKKLLELRQQLHKESYYDPTFNPKNPPAGGEERPAEKVEKEKKMEALELEEKQKEKPPPLAVVRERNKTEMFRGASG